jgi:hypothetical protein
MSQFLYPIFAVHFEGSTFSFTYNISEYSLRVINFAIHGYNIVIQKFFLLVFVETLLKIFGLQFNPVPDLSTFTNIRLDPKAQKY